MIARLRSRARGERGGVLVMVAVFMPVLVAFCGLVIDVGNAFEHKRHLQMQADAGALAAGALFNGCFGDVAAANPALVDTARRYAGDPTFAGPGAFNAQVGGTNRGTVTVRINSKTYAAGTNAPDDTVEAAPCTAQMLDVKTTEAGLPWFFRAAGVPAINAHARVAVRGISSIAGSLPVAALDTHIQSAAVSLIDDATGNVIATQPMTQTTTAGGLAYWDNSAAPFSAVNVTGSMRVRVALSGGSSTTCGAPLVECYDAGTGTGATTGVGGILYTRGYSTAGAVTATTPPIARDVRLVAGTCADPYFVSGPSCTVGVRATIDFGATTSPAAAPPTGVGALVWAFGGASCSSGNGCPLTYDAASRTWQSTGANMITVNAGSGPVPIELRWEERRSTGSLVINGRSETCTTNASNKCKGTFGVVQRSFGAAADRSGPIRVAQVFEGAAGWANSFAIGTAHTLVVKIAVGGNLGLSAPTDPPVPLAVVGGSLTQKVDCDPNVSTLREELARGCQPQYRVNPGTACPAANALAGTPQPWPCVWVETGGAVGQVRQGMDDRVLAGGTCAQHPNRWPNLDFTVPDTRIVTVFVVPFGAFSGAGGSQTVPVVNFATFYVTGWGRDCPASGGFAADDPVPRDGYIVGHWIKYVSTLPADTSSGCDRTSITPCAVVLTR